VAYQLCAFVLQMAQQQKQQEMMGRKPEQKVAPGMLCH